MTTVGEVPPRLQVPPLSETPALARMAVAVVWLVVGLLGRPATTALLLLVAGAVLLAASGYTPLALLRVSWRAMLLIVLIAMLVFALSIDDGRQAAIQAVVTTVLRLTLLFVVALLVIVPQDAESALTEAIGLLHVPSGVAFTLLIAARVGAGMRGDFAEHRAARRAQHLSAGGLRGIIVEPLDAARYSIRATRRRWNALRTGGQVAALGSGPQRSMYRSVSFGRNGRYVLVAGMGVAVVGLLIGLI